MTKLPLHCVLVAGCAAYLGAQPTADAATPGGSTYEQAAALYSALRGQAKAYGVTWKAQQLKGERGETWDYGFDWTRNRKFAFPSGVTSIKGRKIAVGTGVKTHVYYAGQLAYEYSIQRRGRSFIITREGQGYDPGQTFYISPKRTRVAGVTRPAASRSNLYPRAHQNDQRNPLTQREQGDLAAILAKMGGYVGDN